MTDFDRRLASSQVTLVHARRTTTATAAHAHDEAMIFVPLAGALHFEIAGERVVADAQHALVIRAQVAHRHDPGEAVEYFIAYVDDLALARHVRDPDAPAFRFANTVLVRELAGELLSNAEDLEVTAAATLLLCVQAARGEQRTIATLPDDERLARAIRLARERYRSGVSTSELAKAARMSPRAFERALVRACGTTPRQLVEDLRLAEARARLAAGRESVTNVAFDLGYKSLSHFVRRFRAAFGVTPSGAMTGAAKGRTDAAPRRARPRRRS